MLSSLFVLYTWLIQEQLSQRSYRDLRDSKLSFYRTPKGRVVHLLVEDRSGVSAVQIFSDEAVLERDMALLKGLSQKLKSRHKPENVELIGLAVSRLSFSPPLGSRSPRNEVSARPTPSPPTAGARRISDSGREAWAKGQ